MKSFYRKFHFVLGVTFFFISAGIFFALAAPNFDLANLRSQNEVFTRTHDIIRIQEAWEEIQNPERETSLSGVKIGVIDVDGVDINHQEFKGEIISGSLVGNVDFGNTPPSARIDKGGHGTAVAGIIGANNISFFKTLAANSPQMSGVVSGASSTFDYSLEVRKVGSAALLFDRLTALFRSKLSGADIINVSLGEVKRTALTEEQKNSGFIEGQANVIEFFRVTQIWKLMFNSAPGTLFVVSAGNEAVDSSNATPANLGNLPNVIVVGATDLDDQRAEFNQFQESNFGDGVNVSAPGKNVYTSKPDNSYNKPTEILGVITGGFSGTSASAPMVTGVAGLIKAINPGLTPAQIKQILIKSADPIFAPIGSDEADKLFGSGCVATSTPAGLVKRGCRLNAHRAVCHELVLNCEEEPPPGVPLWPMIKFDSQNSGLSPIAGPSFPTSTDVEIKWQRAFAPTLNRDFPPLVDSQGRVYTAIDSSIVTTSSIFALDPETGNTLLEINTVPGRAFSGAIGPDGTIYVCSKDTGVGTLSAFHPTNGEKKWDFSVGGPTPCLGPVVSQDGIIYTSVPPSLNLQTVAIVAINPDGAQRWRYEEQNVAASVPALSNDETQVYVVFSKQSTAFTDHLMAFDAKAETTSIRWDVPSGNSFNTIALVVDPQDRILVNNFVSSFFDIGHIRAFSKNGSELWLSSNLGTNPAPVITPQGNIGVVHGPSGQLTILNPINGSVLESILLPIVPKPHAMVDPNGTFYSQTTFGGMLGHGVAAFDTDGIKWFFTTAVHQAIVAPSIGLDGTLYFKVEDIIYALNVAP